MFLHNGVYFIQNADVGGVLCLDMPSTGVSVCAKLPWNGPNARDLDSDVFQELWFVKASNNTMYTLRNLRSGKYMIANRNGLHISVGDPQDQSHIWTITGDSPGSRLYGIRNVRSKSLVGVRALGLMNGSPALLGQNNRRWLFQQVSRSGEYIKEILKSINLKFNEPQVDKIYLILPEGYFRAIWNSIPKLPSRPGIYDSSEIATVFKAAVTTWGSLNIKPGFKLPGYDPNAEDGPAILCGFVIAELKESSDTGDDSDPGDLEKYMHYNFTLSDNDGYNQIRYFDPGPEAGDFEEFQDYQPIVAFF